MPSIKRLRSVCHSISHHSVSALSYIYPHLRIACRNAGLKTIEIDLLKPNPLPDCLGEIRPLKLAIPCLREKFLSILTSEGLNESGLKIATLLFDFPEKLDEYCTNCYATIITDDGKKVQKAVNYFGVEI